jgi:hypothetical protein
VHPSVDICIVTQLHVSSNPRVVKEADALTEAGYSVAVIAPDFSAWGREADKEFTERPWKIVESPKFGPLSPPLTRIAELARRAVAGMVVRNLGIEHPAGECLKLCVSDLSHAVFRYVQASKRPANIMDS